MKTIETNMPFSRSESWSRNLWVLAVAIFLAAHAWFAPTAWAQWENYEPYSFTTLAGSAGTGILDGIGGAARFLSLVSLAVDKAGIVYVVDSGTIRKLTPTGEVTTVAGLAGGNGVAVDSAGNVYIAGADHTIRKMTPAGVVTTLAGLAGSSGSTDGTGSAARFNYPADVAVDSAGNVYVADFSNRTIRKVTPAGVVTTLAGLAGSWGSADGTGSAARFGGESGGHSGPTGLAVDSAGNVYVNDRFNNTIRKVTPTGLVTTLAGLAGPNGFGSADGKGSAARFNGATDVAVDSAGNVYVADYQNHTIRKVTTTGVTTTLAGPPQFDINLAYLSIGSADGTGSVARFFYPENVAADGAGNVYVTDSGNKTIRKITPAGVVTTLAGSSSPDGTGNSAQFASPSGVVLDSAGNVYVADRDHHTIRKVTAAGVVTTLAGFTLAGFGSSGSADGTGSAARFNHPSGVAVDGAGNLYVADQGNGTIRKVTPTGLVTTLAGLAGNWGSADGPGTVARFGGPTGVAVDSADNVYVADQGNHTIRKVTPAGLVTTLAGMVGSEGSADGMSSAARFTSPSGVAVDSAGNVYVADRDAVRKVTPEGAVTTLAGLAGAYGSVDGTGSVARFAAATGVAVDSAGNVYVADSENHKIRKVTPGGVVTTLAGVSPQFDSNGNLLAGGAGSADGTGSEARFASPSGVAVDSAGNVYVADTANSAVRRGVPAFKIFNLIPDPGLRRAIRQALDQPTADITVADIERLTVLDASRSARGAAAPLIYSLEGLEKGVHLVEIQLSGISASWFGPPAQPNIVSIDLLPLAGLTNLSALDLSRNQLTNVNLPTGLANLTTLDLSTNQLTTMILPAGLSRLATLDISGNQLTNLTLPVGLASLTNLNLENNQLTSLTLPAGLDNLRDLRLLGNPELGLSGNPLTNLTLPAGNQLLWPTLLALRNSNVQVTLLPIVKSPQRLANGDFVFTLFADAGTFTVLRSTDLETWIEIVSVTIAQPNFPGATFADTAVRDQSRVFYRVKSP